MQAPVLICKLKPCEFPMCSCHDKEDGQTTIES